MFFCQVKGNEMKSVPVQEAIGMVLCHDVTQIIPGRFKGRAFKKGHIIRPKDVSKLRDIGKEHVYVWEIQEGFLHEDDAAIRIATAAAGVGIALSEPREGKVELSAASRGLLKINSDALYQINEVDQVICATLHTNQTVTEGKIVAGTRIIPLVIEESKILQVEKICKTHFPLVAVKPFKPHTVGIITTGTEVYHERIKDTFTPVLRNKFNELGSTVVQQRIVPDSTELIAQAIAEFTGDGVELIAVTGGMSVDPDDVTPAGIKAAGGRVITYGAPALPGAMFLLAYIGSIPVLGLPGCVMYHKTTIFDLIVPRILAGEVIAREDIIKLGHGGLCANCEECRYPGCSFGKCS
jgi:molybdenum cofactor synthesis domain-containing protein